MNSIATRLLIAVSLVLAGFVILTSLSVRHSVHSRAEQALFDRLQGLIYGILGASELGDDGILSVNDYELPEQRLLSPVTGLYAEVLDQDGKRLWTSRSTTVVVPPLGSIEIGEWRFRQFGDHNDAVRSLQFATAWRAPDGERSVYRLQVVNDATEFNNQLQSFDRNLWISLLSSALLLLLLQLLILMWGLKPLTRIGDNLRRIEAGDDELLDNRLPIELRPLANSMNTLLQSERNRHLRYRNVMDDLAHSLKTPLSVLRNLQLNRTPTIDTQEILKEQTGRMQDIIAYHLQRAAVGGAQALAPPLNPNQSLQRLAISLKKVYPERNITFRIDLSPTFQLRVNEADLMEIFGNLFENSCKYGASTIVVTAASLGRHQAVYVDDDGPGFGVDSPDSLLQRGIRADNRHEGQGLGLAVTRELMESYGGGVRLENRPQGGARVALLFTSS